MALRLRQIDIVNDVPEQIGEAGERKPRFRLGGLGGEYPQRSVMSLVNGRAPHGGLADTRRPLDEQRSRACIGVVKELGDLAQLVETADKSWRPHPATVGVFAALVEGFPRFITVSVDVLSIQSQKEAERGHRSTTLIAANSGYSPRPAHS
jgi:hypothetical protein